MKYRLFIYQKDKNISSDSLMSLSAQKCRQAFRLDDRCDFAVKRSPLGKPYFESAPIFVSLSHADESVAVVIADCEIGLDIESKNRRLPDYDTQKKLAAKYFSPAERASLESGKYSFAELWVRKEAAVKLTGKGVSGMSHTCTEDGSVLFEKPDLPGFICYIAVKQG